MSSETSTLIRGRSRRIVALDVARFVALAGMMAAHLWMVDESGNSSAVLGVVSGKAAALFAVLAGVGIALTSERLLAQGLVGRARWNLFGRGLALFLIGIILMARPSGIAVILAFYGLVFWLVIPLLTWSARALLVTAGVWVVTWPLISLMIRGWLESALPSPGELELIHIPAYVAKYFLLDGSYPVLTWISYAVVGLAVGRLILDARAQRTLPVLGRRLATIGIAVSGVAAGVSALLLGPAGGASILASGRPTGVSAEEWIYDGLGADRTDTWWSLASPAAHSGTPVDLGITIGIALGVIGVCLLLESRLHARVLTPVAAAGAAPLTIYAIHVVAVGVVTTVWAPSMSVHPSWWWSSPQLWAIHFSVALAIGVVLAILHRRGPLETLVSWTGRRFAAGRRRRNIPAPTITLDSGNEPKQAQSSLTER